MTPQIIGLIAIVATTVIIFLGVRALQNSTYFNPVTPHSEVVETIDGGWREIVRRRNKRYTKWGCTIYAVIVAIIILAVSAVPSARKVQAALWPTSTSTASRTPTTSPTATLKPTLAGTLTHSPSMTPDGSRTIASPRPTTLATARVVYQSIVQTQIVNQYVTVVVTSLVWWTVVVTATPTAIDTPTETPTPSVTPSPTGTFTETATPSPTEIGVAP